MGVFYAFNECGELYFRASKDTPRSQRSVQLVARIKGVNEIISFKKCGDFDGCFFMLLMNLVSYIFFLQGFSKINLKHISFKKNYFN